MRSCPALDGVFTAEAKLNGRELPGSDTTQVSLNLGVATILDRNVFLNVTTGIGVTEDAPDFSIGVSLPIRFQPLGYLE